MSFEHLVQYAEIILGIALVVKLLSFHSNRLYVVFAFLIAVDLAGSALWLVRYQWPAAFHVLDYRTIWLVDRAVVWVLTIWTVALLLNAILAELPGILALSRKVFRYAWVGAAAVGVLSAALEYRAQQAGHSASGAEILGRLVLVSFICERVVASVSLLAILVITAFLLWFPVRISRNLAYFAVGFVIYFSVLTFFLLARSFASQETLRIVSSAVSVIAAACFAYWAVFISPEGEKVPTQISIDWNPSHQQLLLQQLEGLNQSLLRAARR